MASICVTRPAVLLQRNLFSREQKSLCVFLPNVFVRIFVRSGAEASRAMRMLWLLGSHRNFDGGVIVTHGK